MNSEKEKKTPLSELIYGYDACGSPIADLLRELETLRVRVRELEAGAETMRTLLCGAVIHRGDGCNYLDGGDVCTCGAVDRAIADAILAGESQ